MKCVIRNVVMRSLVGQIEHCDIESDGVLLIGDTAGGVWNIRRPVAWLRIAFYEKPPPALDRSSYGGHKGPQLIQI